MSYAALIVGGATLTYSIINSASKNKKAKKLAKQNKRPVFTADGRIEDVYNLTQSEMSNPQLQDYATQQTGQTASNAIDAILKSGGKADFATIQGQYGAQLSPLLQSMAADRANKIASYGNAAYSAARSKDTEFQYNKDAPFKDTQQQIAALRAEAAQAQRDAVNTAASTASNYGIMTSKAGQYGDKATQENKKLSGANQLAAVPVSYQPQLPSELKGYQGARPDGASTMTNPNMSNFGYNDGIGNIIGLDEFNNPIYSA